MIRCRECGKEISDSAKVCLNCGRQTWLGKKEQENDKMAKTILVEMITGVIGFILFVVGVCIMCSDMNKWYGGYNYRFPWSMHEIGVIMLIALGIVWFVGSILKLIKINQKLNDKSGL